MPDHASLSLSKTLESLPALPTTSPHLRSLIRTQLSSTSNNPILIALDDDPTGTQTSHGIPVLTTWSVDVLKAEFERTEPTSGFFILTNSRALQPDAAKTLITEICGNLKEAGEATKKRFEVLLRSDSTLRGHFPGECEAAEESLGQSDVWILAPFFLQGGRYTIDDVHYVAEGDTLVPAAETPFAKDASFGYKNSHLKDWVVEKTDGTVPREKIISLGIAESRTKGPQWISEQLLQAPKGTVVIVNAAAEEDMDTAVLGVLQATAKGAKILFRTGAAFVSARLGIDPIAPITASDLNLDPRVGGLILAGSYVPKTTAQLESLTRNGGTHLATVVLDVETLLHSEAQRDEAITNALRECETALRVPRDVLVMTSRKLVTGSDSASSLDIGNVVAKALVAFVQRLDVRPRYLIAKGGITSSDTATKGLRMRRADIVGQASSGVPLWRCDEKTSKYPGLPYVVFPGNVGSVDALYELVKSWRVERDTMA